MATDTLKPPEGFVLEADIKPPEGFVIDRPRTNFLERYVTSDRPVEDWLPTEQAEVAQDILDSFDKPDDERARISSAIMLSEMFGTDFNMTLTLQPEMMKEIYGDELVRISERFKKEPIEGGFFKKVAESWRRGDRGVTSDIAVYEAAFEGRGSVEDALAIHSKIRLDQMLHPVEGSFMADLVYSGVEVIPGMARGYWEAIPVAFAGMGIGAGMGLAVGQTPPLTISPVEDLPLTAVGARLGLQAGLMTGAAMFWYKQGAGSMYASMQEKGYDPELSKHVAGVAAVPYAIVEFLQVAQLTPGLRQGLLRTTNNTVLRVLGNAAKRYGTTWTTEVFEEVVQEIIIIGAEDIAGYLSDKLGLPEGISEFLLERGRRVWETTKEAGKAMALLPIPGAVVDIRTGVKGIISPEAKAEINKKLKRPPLVPVEKPIIPAEKVAPVAEVPAKAPIIPPEAPAAVTEAVRAEVPTRTVAEIEAEVQRAGLTSEDFELKPEKMAELGLKKIATKIKGKVFAFEFGEEGVKNHADILQKKAPADIKTKDIVPGFEDDKGRFIEQFEIQPPAAKEVVKPAEKPPGLTKAEIEHLGKRERATLRAAQKKGLPVGFKAGEKASQERAKTEILKLKKAQKMTEGRRKTAVELVKAFVEKEKRGDFLKRVSVAKTPRDIEKISEAIEKGVERAEKKLAIGNLKKAAKAISPKKMLPEFAETARKILDSIQIGKIRPETIVKNTELKEMAQEVLDTAREDSVAAFQAQQLLDELRGKTTKTFAINQLSVEAIDQITDTLIALRFQNEADTIAAKDENATEAIRRREEIKKSIVEAPDVPESLGGKQLKKFKLFHDNLESALDAVAGARPGTYDLWVKAKKATTEFIYDVLNKGVDDQIIHNEKARNIFRQILAENGVTQKDILNWSMRPADISLVKKAFDIAPKPEIHKFTLQDAKGREAEFEFTTNELMSIFMHSQNNHNLAVLLKDGMDRFIKGKKQKIRGVTVEVIDDMTDSLTAQQKKIARQVGSKLMDGFNKDAINETSVKLEFFELAKVENYWPARRSIIRTPKGKQVAGAVKTVEGMGLLKERIGIGNPMKLIGFFETTYSTNKNVATYVGLAGPLREAKSVYTTDIIDAMENNGRADEAKLITDLIVRFENQAALLGPLDTIIKRMLGGFAKAKLFLNVKIAPRQQISSFLISAYVDMKYIAEFKGVADKETIEEINNLSPQMKARFEHLQFDRDIGDAFMQNELMNYLTGQTTLIDKTALGMRFFDRNAIVDDYRAVKAEVIDKGVDVKSKEGRALLKDRFEWVVRHTQPMWHPKDRSLIGSDPRPLIRSLTMFMSQREQLVRMVNNSITDYVNSDKTVEDATRLGRSIGAVTLSMAAFTLYNFAWAVLIHKKKRDVLDLGKSFFKDILSLPFFGKYIAKSFEIVFNILTEKPIFWQSFDEGPIEGILGEILIEAIPNFARAAKHYATGERYKSGPNRGEEKWKNELLVATDSLVDAIASLKGIPYYGAKDIARTIKVQITEDEKSIPRLKGE